VRRLCAPMSRICIRRYSMFRTPCRRLIARCRRSSARDTTVPLVSTRRTSPVGLIFTIDARLKKHSWLDYGLFLQTIMIAARARGLDTCPQVSFARYQTIIAEHLLLEPGFDVVCGMSLGYADHDSVVNRLAIPRETVERFTTFVGFDEKA
jgi:nitroreductase